MPLMGETFDIYTLLFLVLAVVIILRLRSVLGQKRGPERPYEVARDTRQAGKDKVIPMTRSEPLSRSAADKASIEDAERRVRDFLPAANPATEGLLSIVRQDQAFDPKHFLNGAKSAYETVVTAFAEGNRKLLKQLLSRDVFDGFVGAISEREGRGEAVDTNFVGIDRTDIIEAELKNRTARVTVKFVSQLITSIRNRGGEIIDGDPKQIREVTDIWTFAREVTSGDPNWKIVATQAAN